MVTNFTDKLFLLKKLVPKEINVQFFLKKIYPYFLKRLKYLRAFSSQGKKQNQIFKKDFRFSILAIFQNHPDFLNFLGIVGSFYNFLHRYHCL
jgi:hypothetical protein